MNGYEKLFDSFLDHIGFELVKYPSGWGVVDLEGANLGDIEQGRFVGAADLIDRLDTYIKDYFETDLEEELDIVGISAWDREGLADLLKIAREKASAEWQNQHKFEMDVLDMVLHHAGEVQLSQCQFTYGEEWSANE